MIRPSRLLSVMVMLSVTFAQLLSNQRSAAQSQGVTPPQQSRSYLDLPIHIETPIQPIPVKGTDGKWYLVYHLFLTNLSFSDLTLKSVEVFDGERGITLARYGDRELSDIDRFTALIPTPPRSEMPNNVYPRQIASGRTGALFFWLTVDAPNAIPSALRHRFVFERNPLIRLRRNASSGEAGDMVLEGFRVAVSSDRPIVIGAPLRGGPWRCSNGPAYNSAHQV